MSKILSAIRLINHPLKLIRPMVANGYLKWLPDKTFYLLVYKASTGKKLNLENPKLFNEKIQWLKLYYRRPELTDMVDKYKVRNYIADKIGENYLVPLLGKWDTVEEIEFSKLPNQFVLKCNHDQGSAVICKNKEIFNWAAEIDKLQKKLKSNHYQKIREWPYKNIVPCVIGEKYLENDSKNEELTDYKVLCFNGEPKLIEVHYGRFKGIHTQDFYDIEWKKTNFNQPNMPKTGIIMEKPSFVSEMIELSRILSKDFPHVRVDWYYADNQLYFSELTFYDGSGFTEFLPGQDELIGKWLTLPDSKI